jgi:hypothetical protein
MLRLYSFMANSRLVAQGAILPKLQMRLRRKHNFTFHIWFTPIGFLQHFPAGNRLDAKPSSTSHMQAP